MKKTLLFALSALSATLTTQAGAVGTRSFALDSSERISAGELKFAQVSPDGTVRPGLSLSNLSVGANADASSIWSHVELADGSVLLGTGPSGKVFRVLGDKVTEYADTGALAVTSLVLGASGTVYAATLPDGKIFKLTQGKAELFATLGPSQVGGGTQPAAGNIWQLAETKAGLFAVAGPEGRVYKVEASGSSSVYFKSDETNLVSIAALPSGELLVGSSSKAILYRVTGPGRANVVYDFAGDEVKAIAVAKNGTAYVTVNEYSEAPEAPRRSGGTRPPGPGSSSKGRPGKGALYKVDDRGRVEKLMKHDEFHYTTLALDPSGSPVVGTGAEGRVYTVDDAHTVTLLADTDERQINGIGFAGGKPKFLIASDPGVFHRVTGNATDATWTSKALDCGAVARFGTLSYRSSGSVEVSVRTGNTQTPDATWTNWGSGLKSGNSVGEKPARFLQVRAKLRDEKATFAGLVVPFSVENQRAVVTEVSVNSKTLLSRESGTGTAPSFESEVPKHESSLKINWRVENPDGDPLRYRLAAQREGSTLWRELLKPEEALTKTDFSWETMAVAEGRYRIRVQASDELANAPGDVHLHQLVSEAFVVDNTPPAIERLEIKGKTLSGLITDGASAIVRVEFSVDGKSEFRPLPPGDGLWDSQREVVTFDLSQSVSKGAHAITVRAYDAAGNTTLKEIEGNVQ
jgi:hypothetical protein